MSQMVMELRSRAGICNQGEITNESDVSQDFWSVDILRVWQAVTGSEGEKSPSNLFCSQILSSLWYSQYTKTSARFYIVKDQGR